MGVRPGFRRLSSPSRSSRSSRSSSRSSARSSRSSSPSSSWSTVTLPVFASTRSSCCLPSLPVMSMSQRRTLPRRSSSSSSSRSIDVMLPGAVLRAASAAWFRVTAEERGAWRSRSSLSSSRVFRTLPLPASTVTSCHFLSVPRTSSSQTARSLSSSSSSSSASVTVPGTLFRAAATAWSRVVRVLFAPPSVRGPPRRRRTGRRRGRRGPSPCGCCVDVPPRRSPSSAKATVAAVVPPMSTAAVIAAMVTLRFMRVPPESCCCST